MYLSSIDKYINKLSNKIYNKLFKYQECKNKYINYEIAVILINLKPEYILYNNSSLNAKLDIILARYPGALVGVYSIDGNDEAVTLDMIREDLEAWFKLWTEISL